MSKFDKERVMGRDTEGWLPMLCLFPQTDPLDHRLCPVTQKQFLICSITKTFTNRCFLSLPKETQKHTIKKTIKFHFNQVIKVSTASNKIISIRNPLTGYSEAA